MANVKYISLILLLIVLVTLANLFYKPWIYDAQPKVSQFFRNQIASPIARSTCPLYGLKCANDELCDCARMCTNGEFVPFRVLPNEPIFLMDHRLTAGTYCLPKGIGSCNQKTSYHVFSLTGWKCVNRNKSLYNEDVLVACKSERARDAEYNILRDRKENGPAKEIEDPYETLDGKLARFFCQCKSRDLRGHRMVSVLPFTCSEDYCITNIANPATVMGYKGGKCECGVYPHLDPDDEASPCVMERTRVEKDDFIGVVKCMTDDAWEKSPIFCPSGDGVLTFKTPAMGGKSAHHMPSWSTYVHRANTVQEASAFDAFILYSLNGGIFYVKRKEFPSFSYYWCVESKFPPFTLDLASAQQHALIFDLDFHATSVNQISSISLQLLSCIHSTLKLLFLPNVKHFTYVIAARSRGKGLHVHLPEFVISHDDYILLCEHLKTPLGFQEENRGTYSLDILQNVMLAGSNKPDAYPYRPVTMIYVDEKETYRLDVRSTHLSEQLTALKKSFKRVKYNTNSFFRTFLFLEEQQAAQHLRQLMMPVVSLFQPVYKLSFATVIGSMSSESGDLRDIATFTYKRSDELGFVCKGKQLLFDGSHFLKTFQYVRFNAFLMESLETNNAALKRWYERALYALPEKVRCDPAFDKINQTLRENNSKFVHDPNPIKTILEYNRGYYFLPTFYASCKCLNIPSNQMVHRLKPMLDEALHPLLDRLEQLDPSHTQLIMNHLTQQTITFCGNNLCERHARYRDKLKQIVNDSTRAILSVTTPAQMVELLRRLQESHFPIQVMRLSNSLRKASAFIWNCLTESWQEIQADKEKESHMGNLWNAIGTWLEEYRKTGNYGGPDPQVLDRFSIGFVMSTITSDSNMERKTVQMDRHKWFIRTQDGLWDILTGHVGGTVPELFLSDRKLGVEFSRSELSKLFHDSKELEQLYDVLTDHAFFMTYLKALFTDRTDDLYDTLHEMIREELPHLAENTRALSMMHFYVHLCKYTGFERDLLMYLMDVLASVLIATNYERKFFVMKGETSNGKSKLFEILGRVFGGYYHCIQSDNLKPGNSSTNATPDLASTLFNCRIVTTEELEGKLNENRVKQITGNSCVVFRNMYEPSQGGIPTAKLFTTTNNLPDCRATEAFQDRVTAIPFLSKFVNKAPTTTSEQVRLNRFGKEEYVVERSYVGCFLMMVYHLKRYIDIKDGLLHYRDEPPSVVEYTKLYLFNTDVYNQFKTHMDVQVNVNTMTTMSDLRSAVRQFLKNTKNNTTPETDLILKFEEEFSEYRRRSDIQLGSIRYTSILDQENEPLFLENSSLQEGVEARKRSLREMETSQRKKLKKSFETDVVFYENVVIRNLKRVSNEN
ncbi:hypothetical protein AVEN_261776-1 [Araneus ventricosus]|uniref:SF3 helicase domain-containing protein n=1 Tax=Araneus ventricosus TaxID=182803 RepID=A0A4Y2LY21_ARAVE|nr:hypothetical protein AVEN_261776-1 [Araneus ventricosus]